MYLFIFTTSKWKIHKVRPGPQETPGRGRGSKFKMCQDNRSPVAQAQNKANKVSQITSTVTISSTGVNSLEVSSI